MQTKQFFYLIFILQLFSFIKSDDCHYLLEFKVNNVYCEVLKPDKNGNKIQFSYDATVTQRILDHRLVQIKSNTYKINQQQVELYDTKKLSRIDCFSTLSFNIQSYSYNQNEQQQKSGQVVVSVDVDEIYEKTNYNIQKSNKAFVKGLKCENLNNIIQREVSFDATRMGIVTIDLQIPAEISNNFNIDQLDQEYEGVFSFNQNIYTTERIMHAQSLNKPSMFAKTNKPKNKNRHIKFNDQVKVSLVPTNQYILDEKIQEQEDKQLLNKFIIEDDYAQSSEDEPQEYYEKINFDAKPSVKEQLAKQKRIQEMYNKLKELGGNTDENLADRYFIQLNYK